jgi:hypothetical protein
MPSFLRWLSGNTTGTLISPKSNQWHSKGKVVSAQLEDLKTDMAELNQILNTALRQTVKEVILMETSILSVS